MKKYYTKKDVEIYFGVCSRTVQRWINEGLNGVKIKAIEVKGFKRITYKDLREFEKLTFGR